MNEIMDMQKDSEHTIDRLTATIEQLKKLNLQTVEKGEELKQQIIKLKKLHAQELKDKIQKASKRGDDVEAEI